MPKKDSNPKSTKTPRKSLDSKPIDSPKKSIKIQSDSQIFTLESTYSPAGDQPQAIAKITQSFKNGANYATLLGVTGSGKTFTMANIIATLNMPTLIMTQVHRI